MVDLEWIYNISGVVSRVFLACSACSACALSGVCLEWRGCPVKKKVLMSIDAEVLKRIDETASRAKMERSEFLETLVSIAIEEQQPYIDFAIALGAVRARLIWPKWKPAKVVARA